MLEKISQVSINQEISLKFVAKVWMNNIPALVQIMVWRWWGDKPLSEPMMGLVYWRIYASLDLNELMDAWMHLTEQNHIWFR